MRTEAPAVEARGSKSSKHAAILAAARDLFLRDGVERTSMDDVAGLAGVSKRTVYDYFGDKRSLLLAVIRQAEESGREFLRQADQRNLVDVGRFADVEALGCGLARFARDLGRTVIAATDYVVVDHLSSENAAILPELVANPLGSAAELLLAERFAGFAEEGLLDAPDPGLAARHFKALTISLALSDIAPHAQVARPPDTSRIDRIMKDGVAAFMRAYGHRE